MYFLHKIYLTSNLLEQWTIETMNSETEKVEIFSKQHFFPDISKQLKMPCWQVNNTTLLMGMLFQVDYLFLKKNIIRLP